MPIFIVTITKTIQKENNWMQIGRLVSVPIYH